MLQGVSQCVKNINISEILWPCTKKIILLKQTKFKNGKPVFWSYLLRSVTRRHQSIIMKYASSRHNYCETISTSRSALFGCSSKVFANFSESLESHVILKEPAKKVLFLVNSPLRGGGCPLRKKERFLMFFFYL